MSDEAEMYAKEFCDRIEAKYQRIVELERKVALLEVFVQCADLLDEAELETTLDYHGELYEAARAALDWLPR